jgi:aminocarboxymuconate-semialdehyde decarboxylase
MTAAAIDVHAHIIPPCVPAAAGTGTWHGVGVARRPDGLLEITMPGKAPNALPWTRLSEDVDARLAHMDGHDVRMQLLSLLPSLWLYGASGHDTVSAARQVNDELAALAKEHPLRFRAFAHLPLDQPDEAVAELERAMASEGVVGAAVATNVAGRNWDEPELFPVLESAERLGALLFFHPAAVRFVPHMSRYHLRNLIGNPAETTTAIASLIFGGVLDRLPELRAVFAHGGGYATLAAGRFDHGWRVRPEAKAGCEHPPSTYLRRLWFDSLVHSEAALGWLVGEVGADRVVLGSDYPADMGDVDPVRTVGSAACLDDSTRVLVLGGNLARLLGLDPD